MNSGENLFISAGDVSGDIHAAGLIQVLRRQCPDLNWVGLGGRSMEAAGCILMAPPETESIMGFRRVARRIPHYFKLLARVAAYFRNHRPRMVILVDYPGLNLRIAALAKQYRIPVTYFICPQLWAWAPWRIKKFARLVDLALVIFPFEEAYYRRHGVQAHFVGHPVCDRQNDDPVEQSTATLPQGELIGLLPGSRRQEICANLPIMLNAYRMLSQRIPGLLPVFSHYRPELIDLAQQIANDHDVDLITLKGGMRRLAKASRFCFVGSGTATLEVALTRTPMVVVYRTSNLGYWLAPYVLTVPYFCQVNLMAGEKLVHEILINHDRADDLIEKVLPLVREGPARAHMQERLKAFSMRFNRPGALDCAANWVEKSLN